MYRGQGTERHTLTSLGKLSHSSCLLGKGTLGERQLPPCGWYGDRRNLVPKETWRSCSANAGAGQTGPQLVTKLSAPEEASYLQKPRPAPHRPDSLKRCLKVANRLDIFKNRLFVIGGSYSKLRTNIIDTLFSSLSLKVAL